MAVKKSAVNSKTKKTSKATVAASSNFAAKVIISAALLFALSMLYSSWHAFPMHMLHEHGDDITTQFVVEHKGFPAPYRELVRSKVAEHDDGDDDHTHAEASVELVGFNTVNVVINAIFWLAASYSFASLLRWLTLKK